MLFFDRDLVSPLINLGWLAVALFAAWCIGRPYGLGPQAMIGASVALGSQSLVEFQAGEALNDITGSPSSSRPPRSWSTATRTGGWRRSASADGRAAAVDAARLAPRHRPSSRHGPGLAGLAAGSPPGSSSRSSRRWRP